jgi:hypothetical protein
VDTVLALCLLFFAHAADRNPGASELGALHQKLGMAAPARRDFVSYRHGGARRSRELVSALEADGYRVAIDERTARTQAS